MEFNKAIYVFCAVASFSSLGQELIKFKSGDIATAESFNNNFELLNQNTLANANKLDANSELLLSYVEWLDTFKEEQFSWNTAIELNMQKLSKSYESVNANLAKAENNSQYISVLQQQLSSESNRIDNQAVLISKNIQESQALKTQLDEIGENLDSNVPFINQNAQALAAHSQTLNSHGQNISENSRAIASVTQRVSSINAPKFTVYMDDYGLLGEVMSFGGIVSIRSVVMKKDNLIYNINGSRLSLRIVSYMDENCTVPIVYARDAALRGLGDAVVSMDLKGDLYAVNLQSEKYVLENIYSLQKVNPETFETYDRPKCLLDSTSKNGIRMISVFKVDTPDFVYQTDLNTDFPTTNLSNAIYINYAN
ncbi:hypothetical protein ACSLBF_20210 (plasmid) [Pseudoalteromonas sp. T1lg65]|uniref:hypothetical protein n=1 Tax=Pseudoalteromonas sp. T1lg65 TaxID=2077101 RepID=UPI003F79D82A